MNTHFFVRYKKLIIIAVLFTILLLIYLFSGEIIAKYWETDIQGEHVTGRHILATLLWLIAAIEACAAVDLFLWEGMVRRRTGNPVPNLLKSTANTVIFLIAIIFVVALVYHKSITGLLATTGAVGIVLGFALKGIIENAFQGIALNIAQVFKTGDIISIPNKFDELAEVKDITTRNTYLQDFVGHVIAIPNTVISENVIKNYSRPKLRIFSVCMTITLGVRGLSILDVLRVLHAVVVTVDFVSSTPAPQILIADIQSTQVRYDINCWCEREKVTPNVAKHTIYMKIVEQLSAAGFGVGSPAIDYEEIEKRITAMLYQFDLFSHLKPEERKEFFRHEMEDKRPLTVLSQVSLFSSLTHDEVVDLSHCARILTFRAGDTIIRQGDTTDMMYVLVEGALQVYIHSADQKELIPVAKLIPGRYFGEMSLLVGEPRSATVTAITDCMVYEITKDTMITLFEKQPDMIQKISEKIAEQQLVNMMKEQEFSSQDAKKKKENFASDFVKRIKKFFWKH